MFTIYGGKTEFSQWEQGQRVTNPKLAVGDKVRFWNASGETHPMIAYMHEGVVVADVPNDLLQHCSPILVELCGDPECLTRFIVIAQDKPAGYKFIDNTFCEPAAPSSGGGVSCWNDIPDKPFVKVGGDTLTWDGNTEGQAIGTICGIPVYVKVSDVVLTIDDFANGGKMTVNGEIVDFTSREVAELDLIFVGPRSEAVIVPPELAGIDLGGEDYLFPEGTIFPEAGLYFVNGDGSVTTSLTIPGYTGFAKEQIDPKVLPEALQFGKTTVPSDTLTVDWESLMSDIQAGNAVIVDSTEAVVVKVSDAVLTEADFANGIVLIDRNGNEFSVSGDELSAIFAEHGFGMGEVFFCAPTDNYEIPSAGMSFPEKGVYFADSLISLTIPGYSGFTKTEIKPIKPEYLPGAVVLYTDAEMYLYVDSDISDTNKRITKAELEKIALSGRPVHLGVEQSNGLILTAIKAFGLLNAFGVVTTSTDENYYTAEYTA